MVGGGSGREADGTSMPSLSSSTISPGLGLGAMALSDRLRDAGLPVSLCTVITSLLDAADPAAAAAAAAKKAPLLYEKEIDDRLKAAKPWLHDPAWVEGPLKRAVRVRGAPPQAVLREDDLQAEYDTMDAAVEQQAKLSRMLKQNLTMHQMYDCNGTGRRGGQMPRGENPFQQGGMIRLD